LIFRGLFRHYLIRSRWSGVACLSGALLFQVLVIVGWLNFQRSGAMSAAPLLRRTMPRWLQSAFGIEGAQVGQLNTFLTLASQHPFLLLVVLALPMAMLSNFLAGDTEKRTLALILARPVGRLWVSGMAVGVTVLRLSSVVLASLLGVWIGGKHLPGSAQLIWSDVLQVHLNLWALGLATTGLALWPAILAQTRGGALGLTTAAGVAMYVLHFLVQVVPTLKPLGRLGVFHYYNPGQALLLGGSLTKDTTILLTIALVSLVGGLAIFRRRDLPL
jgi:hypothetical protein